MSIIHKNKRAIRLHGQQPGTSNALPGAAGKIAHCVFALALLVTFGIPSGVAGIARADEGTSVEGTSLHQATKITVEAFPLKDDGETWDTLTSKGKSAATTKISARGGMLRLRVSVVWDDGQTISESDTEGWGSRPGFSQGFTYVCSDTDKLAVDSRGIMTALSDGEVTVEVTPNNEAHKGMSASIRISTHNQAGGFMATKVTIVDEDDKAYGDDPIKFTKLQQSKKVYAKVTFKNTDAAAYWASIDKKLKSELVSLDNEKQAKSKQAGDEAEQKAREKATAEWNKKKEKAEAKAKAEAEAEAEAESEAEDEGEAESEVEAAEDENGGWTEADQKKAEQAINKAAREARSAARAEVDKEYSEKIQAARKNAADKKAQVRETVVYSNAPKASSDEKPTAYEEEHYYKTVEEAFSTLTWQVGDTEYLSATNHDGVLTLKAKANALTRLYAIISSGDTSKNKGFGVGRVYGSASVNVNDAERARADGSVPADKLTIKVIYDKMPDTVAVEKTYTIEQFEALGAITRTYTMTQKGGKYVTDRAYGVPLATILTKLKIDADDVSYFTLAANDNANPGKLSAKFLLKSTRYYLPNYDIGGSWQDKEQVPTMLALKDSWNSNTTVTGELNTGTRFRLVFGATTSADQVTDKSIKFINAFTIVLKGAPPSTHGNDESNVSQGGNGTQGNGTGGSATGANGSGTPTAAQSTDSQSKGDGDGGAGTAKTQQEQQEKPWSIFEMMNNSKSNVPVEFEDNPLLPWALPATIALLLLAAIWRLLVFRHQLGNTTGSYKRRSSEGVTA